MLKVHVHVRVVRRSHHGNLVLVQLCVVVQATPVLLLSQQVSNLSQRTQRGILLVVPGEDVLAGEEQTVRIRCELGAGSRHASSRPVGRRGGGGQLVAGDAGQNAVSGAVSVNGLVHQGVQRVRLEGYLGTHSGQELIGEVVVTLSESGLQEVVQTALAPAATQEVTSHLEAVIGQTLTGGQVLLVGAQVLSNAGCQLGVLGEPAVVLLNTFLHAVEGVLVDVVHGGTNRCQARGDAAVTQRLRRERQVGQGQEATEGLTNGGPALVGTVSQQHLADSLRVSDDGVRTEQLSVLSLNLRVTHSGDVASRQRGRHAGTALIQKNHAVSLRQLSNPAANGAGLRRTETGAALQVHNVRTLISRNGQSLVGAHNLAGEHGDGLVRETGGESGILALGENQTVGQGNLEPVVGNLVAVVLDDRTLAVLNLGKRRNGQR